MSSFLIVGPPGVGKTTVLEALSAQGYATLDADNDTSLCGWVDQTTGMKVADWSPELIEAPFNCAWGWDKKRMHEIMANPPGDPFFFAGNSIGVSAFYTLFDTVFALYTDNETLIQRLTSPRNNPNNYGQKPEHITQTLAINNGFKVREQARGAVLINASKPLSEVLDSLIQKTS